MTNTSRRLTSRSSYLPRRHGRYPGPYSLRGDGGRASSGACRHAASRRIVSKLVHSSDRRRDTNYSSRMSTYSLSGTGYDSDTSTYSSHTTGYESCTSTDDLTSSFLSDTYGSNTATDESSYSIATATGDSYTSADGSSYTLSDGEYDSYDSADESSDSLCDDEYDSYESTDESSDSLCDDEYDSYESTDESSDSLSDGEYDSYDSTDEGSDSLSSTDASYCTSTFEKATEGSTGTERKALTISLKIRKTGCRADGHSSTDDSYYSDTGKNTESDSSEKSLPDSTSFSTRDYYSGNYDKRRHGLKRCSSGRKWRSSTKDGLPTVTASRKYRRSTFRGQSSKRRASYCACAGGENKKRRRY